MSEELVREEIEQATELQDPTTLTEYYSRLRIMVESIESDVLKSQKGNKAAGTRLRKNLRLLKKTSADFVRFSLGK